MLVAASLITVLGFSDMDELIARQGIRSRSGVETVAYETKSACNLWPFLLLTLRYRSRLDMLVILGCTFVVFASEILFQKRLGTAYCLVFVFVFAFVLPRYSQLWPKSSVRVSDGKLRLIAGCIVVFGGIAAYLSAPDLATNQVDALVNRFRTEERGDRFIEARVMFGDLEGIEYVVGRGFGGHFEIHSVNAIRFGERLRDVKRIGKRYLHVGCLMPQLKGGVLFLTAYHLGVVYVLCRPRQYVRNPIDFSCFVMLAAISAQSLVGGLFLMSSSFDMVLLGASLGRCLATVHGPRADKRTERQMAE